MKSSITAYRISPKKANLVAGLVRYYRCDNALNLLKFANKKVAKVLYKLIESAVANADHTDRELYVKMIRVSKWPTLKRWRPSSRWRTEPVLKRTSNIYVELWTL